MYRDSHYRVPTGPYFLEKSLLLNMGPLVLEKYLVLTFLQKGPGKVLIFCWFINECLIVRYYKVGLVSSLQRVLGKFITSQFSSKVQKLFSSMEWAFLNSCEIQVSSFK